MRNTLSYAVLRIDACENIDVDLEDRLAVTSVLRPNRRWSRMQPD